MKQISDVDTTTSSRPALEVGLVMARSRPARVEGSPKHARPRIRGRSGRHHPSFWHTPRPTRKAVAAMPELLLEDLPGRALGKRSQEVNDDRDLVGRDATLAGRDEFLGGGS